MEIQLPTPLIIQAEITSDTVSTHQTIDDATAKTVSAILIVGQLNGENLYRTLLLWSGEAYDNAVQWTDEDVAARVIELLTT